MPQIIFDLIYCLVFGVIIYTVKELIPLIKTKLESTKYSWAAEIIEYAVRAYEQTIGGSGMGDHKYAQVFQYVQNELAKQKITLTDEQINLLIESAVQVMNAEKLIVAEGEKETNE